MGSLHLLSVLNNVESRTESRMWDLVSVGWRCNAERSTRWACWVEVQAWTSGAESWVACWMVLTITSPSYKISKRRKSRNWRQPTAWLQEQAHMRPAALRLSGSCQSLSRTSPSRRGLLLQSFNLQSHWTATSIMSSPRHHDRDSIGFHDICTGVRSQACWTLEWRRPSMRRVNFFHGNCGETYKNYPPSYLATYLIRFHTYSPTILLQADASQIYHSSSLK